MRASMGEPRGAKGSHYCASVNCDRNRVSCTRYVLGSPPVQWSAYLASQPAEEAAALVNDLTAGYGGLSFMVRQLVRNGELREVVTVLDRAELMLDRAYRRLGVMPERPLLPTPSVVATGQPWQAYMAARPHEGGPALLARLQDIVAQARVAGEVIGADGTVEEMAIHLRAALDQLQQLRAEMAAPE